MTRLLAAAVALALVVGGVLLAVEIVVGYYFDRGPWLAPYDTWYADAGRTTWSERAVISTFVVIALVGLALLLLQLLSRRPTTLALQPTNDRVDTDVNRRSLEQAMTRVAERVDGVSGAKVRAGRGVRVRASTERRTPGDLQERVRQASVAVLDELGLQERLGVDVDVISQRSEP